MVGLLTQSCVSDPRSSQETVFERAIDGDTFILQTGEGTQTVRLYGIDCPESIQPGGPEATEYAVMLMRQGIDEVKQIDSDRYGRIIVEIDLMGGKSMTEAMVASGHGWWYRLYAPHDEKLIALESEAKAAKRGLWSEPDPIAPWKWRKGKRVQPPMELDERNAQEAESILDE